MCNTLCIDSWNQRWEMFCWEKEIYQLMRICSFFTLQHDSADSDDECKYYSKEKTKE